MAYATWVPPSVDIVQAASARTNWPWREESFKPSDDQIRNLTKAGALIAAEIDRLHAMRSRSEQKSLSQEV